MSGMISIRAFFLPVSAALEVVAAMGMINSNERTLNGVGSSRCQHAGFDQHSLKARLAHLVEHVDRLTEERIVVSINQDSSFGVGDLVRFQTCEKLVQSNGIFVPANRAFLGYGERNGVGGITCFSSLRLGKSDTCETLGLIQCEGEQHEGCQQEKDN